MLVSRYSPSSSVVKPTLSGAPRALLSRVVDEDRVTLAEACSYSVDFSIASRNPLRASDAAQFHPITTNSPASNNEMLGIVDSVH